MINQKTLQETPTNFIPTEGFVVPPPAVLWAWLNYVYQTTGEWLMPPTATGGSSASAAPTPPTPFEAGAAMYPGYAPSTVPNALPGANPVGPGAAIQYPFPQMVSVALVAGEEAKKARNRATGYRYLDSPYYHAAKSLIEKHAAVPIDPSMLLGCTLVLSLVLAWCNFPLFKSNGREGRWMTLGFDHCTRELKMRSASFKAYLTELERAGLVLPGRVATGIISSEEFERLRYDAAELGKDVGGGETGFWHARALQHTNNIYQLKVFPDPALEEFNPFQNSGKHLGNTWEGPHGVSGQGYPGSEGGEKGRETRGKHHVTTSEGPGRANMVFPGSSGDPTCMNESINECMHVGEQGEIKKVDKQEGDKIHIPSAKSPIEEQFDRVIATMTPRQKAKFDFLSQARFPNFRTEKGQEILDPPECVKFALDDELTLDVIQAHYFEVLEKWGQGQARKNPLGWLHSQLTKQKEGEKDDERSESNLPGRRRQRRRGAMGGNGAGKKQSRPAAQKTTSESSLPIDENGNFYFR